MDTQNNATTKWIDLGAASAYAIYVEHGGTLSEEEWIQELATTSANAAAAKEAASQASASAKSAAESVQQVSAEGTKQIGLVDDAGTEQIRAIEEQGTKSKDAVTAEGAKQIGLVSDQGIIEVHAVADEGTKQIGLVGDAGTAQIGLVGDAGAEQIDAVEAKGAETIASIPADYTELSQDVADLKSAIRERIPVYGASGFTNADPTLTRLYDAVGLVAQVGTDGDNSLVHNDFDDLAPFNRKKCVGHWEAGEDRAIFVVEAYEGDPDYAEDGTMGDYVAVDCPPAYVWESDDGDIRAVSPVKLAGFRPFACLESKDMPGYCREHTYLPVYALALDENGHAVSLPGYSNRQGDYASLLGAAKTYANADVQQYCHLMPDDVAFYEETLYDIEFATHNCQSIMQGCAGLRHDNADRVEMVDATHWIIKNYQAARVAGEYVSIQDVSVDINSASYYASHKIVSIERCDADGTPNTSGTCQLIVTEDLGLGRTYTAGTEYRIAARPYNTGACAGVSTPSGSPVSNSDSYHPMKYRHRENVFGNQYQTTMDLFDLRVSNGEDGYYLEWYKMIDLDAGTVKNYGAADMRNGNFAKLDYITLTENYKNGYITDEVYDRRYPDTKIPVVGTGGSASKFVCDYAFLVSSSTLRSVRRFGYWSSGAPVGFGYRSANPAPSSSIATSGGGLYVSQ